MECEMIGIGSPLGSDECITQREKLTVSDLDIDGKGVNGFQGGGDSPESITGGDAPLNGVPEENDVEMDSDGSVVDEVVDSSPAVSEVIVGDICDDPSESPIETSRNRATRGDCDIMLLGDAMSDDEEPDEDTDVVSDDEDDHEVEITGDIYVNKKVKSSDGEDEVIELDSDEELEDEEDLVDSELEDEESDEVVEVEDEDSSVSEVDEVNEAETPRVASPPHKGAVAAKIMNDGFQLRDGDAVIEAPSFTTPYLYTRPKNESMLKTWMDLRREELVADGKSVEEADKALIDEIEEREKEEKKQQAKPKRKKGRRRKRGSDSEDDAEWTVEHENSESDSDSDLSDDVVEMKKEVAACPPSVIEQYCEKPIGRFLFDVGLSLAQEFVALHVLRAQKRKVEKEATSSGRAAGSQALNAIKETLESVQAKNARFNAPSRFCLICDFETTSETVMDWHLEAPHVPNHCNFCLFISTYPVAMMDHFRIKHKRKCRFEPTQESLATRMHCHLCPFEERVKFRFQKHVEACRKRHDERTHLDITCEFDPAGRSVNPVAGHPASQTTTMTRTSVSVGAVNQRYHFFVPREHVKTAEIHLNSSGGAGDERFSFEEPPVEHNLMKPIMNASGRNATQPSLRNAFSSTRGRAPAVSQKYPFSPSVTSTRFAPAPVINLSCPDERRRSRICCEICDGHIKDLDQLGHHLKLIHKIYLHPRLLHSRAPLNCQKCQDRFFTDQGLERHLLGAHGLVTSSMSDAAKQNKDCGRCPVCGKMFQSKLIHHVSMDHKRSLKPAHLSYKCTVCTATFSLYRSFEQHVYEKHSSLAGATSSTDNSGNKRIEPSGSKSHSLALFRKPGFGGVPASSGAQRKDVEPVTIDLSDDDDVVVEEKKDDSVGVENEGKNNNSNEKPEKVGSSSDGEENDVVAANVMEVEPGSPVESVQDQPEKAKCD